jgi:hypothetical protein
LTLLHKAFRKSAEQKCKASTRRNRRIEIPQRSRPLFTARLAARALKIVSELRKEGGKALELRPEGFAKPDKSLEWDLT